MKPKFNVIARINPQDRTAAPRYYPSVVTNGRVNERELASMIADNSTLTTVDVVAVIEALLQMIPRLLAEGYIVELGQLGSFRTRIRSTGEDSPELVTASNIIKIMPYFVAGKLFKKVLQVASFEKARS